MSLGKLEIDSEDLKEQIERQIRSYRRLEKFFKKSLPFQRRISILESSDEEIPDEEKRELKKKYINFLRRIDCMNSAYTRTMTLINLYENCFGIKVSGDIEEISDEMREFCFYSQRKLNEMHAKRLKL